MNLQQLDDSLVKDKKVKLFFSKKFLCQFIFILKNSALIFILF